MTLTTGQILQERYRIVALLGQGGMGAVYRAWDTRLGVAVAIKEMIPDPTMDAARLLEAREQFHREASVLSRLSHPHLVRVSDFFDENGNTYLVMAFVEGESLAGIIKRSGGLPEAQVLAWADQLLSALQYCHQEGVLHRDIKPQNVIVQPNGSVVLVDFGLVKLWNPEDPRTRTVIRSMGTPQYAPPEQYEPNLGHTDPRSDLYSLGATLYHALTGQVPPTATTRVVNPGMLVPVRQFNPGVSPRVERALERAMALRPDERYQSAQEMRLDLIALPDTAVRDRPRSCGTRGQRACIHPNLSLRGCGRHRCGTTSLRHRRRCRNRHHILAFQPGRSGCTTEHTYKYDDNLGFIDCAGGVNGDLCAGRCGPGIDRDADAESDPARYVHTSSDRDPDGGAHLHPAALRHARPNALRHTDAYLSGGNRPLCDRLAGTSRGTGMRPGRCL